LVENLPAIIHESVKPMERIDSIKILQVDGMPGFSNGANGGPTTSPSTEGSPSADGIDAERI
jgi:uncharacterized membrane protein YqiK